MTRMSCGAEIGADDVSPCPDPYCRVCRDHTGEVIDKPWDGPTAAQVADVLRRYQFNYTDEYGLQDGIEKALTVAGFKVEREVRLNPRDRIDLLVGTVGLEVKVAGRTSNVARQCARYLTSEKITELILVTNRARHNLGVGAMPEVTVVSVVRPW